jgi:hypothetical protein
VDHGFAINGRRVQIGGSLIFVYEFSDATAVETASAGVSADEYSIVDKRVEGETTIEVHGDWVETPHLYKKGRLIVISGENPGVLNAFLTPNWGHGSPEAEPVASSWRTVLVRLGWEWGG